MIGSVFQCLLLVTFYLFTTNITHADPIDLNQIRSGALVGLKSRYLIDEGNALTLDQLPAENSESWVPGSKDIISLGYSTASVWIQLEVVNNSTESEWFLDIAYPVLDNVDIYIQYKDRSDTYELGDRVGFNVRPINHRNFVVPVSLQLNETAKITLRVSSGTSLQVPMILWKQSDLHSSEQGNLIWQGIYFGFILVMTFYNLCLFYYIREDQYIYYALVFGSFVLFQATLTGFSYQFLWPFLPEWNEHALPIFLGLVLFSESLFVRSFLGLVSRAPKIATFLNLTALASLFIILLSIVIPYRISIILLIVLALPINIICLVMGFKQWLSGDKAAQLFTIAWLGTLVGAVALALSKLGFLERNMFNENALQIGTTISVVWLSFALGEYIAQQGRERQNEKENALNYALKMAQERKGKLDAQETLLSTQRQANENLEFEVQQRTNLLKEAMVDLEQANARLQQISHLDDLTGLYNRRYFNKKFEAEFKRAQRLQHPLSVIIADIDHFKEVNDQYGHLVGDACLKTVSKVLKDHVTRPEDTLARFGGEEFIILLPETPTKGASHVAEQLLKGVENAIVHFEDLSISVTISIGVAVACPIQSDSPDDIVSTADEALYKAKDCGRNCIRIADNYSNEVASN